MTAATHGGRRGGLVASGSAPKVNVVLDVASVLALASLAAEHRLTRSEVVRRLLLGRPLDELDDSE